jgi:hypothetical protein
LFRHIRHLNNKPQQHTEPIHKMATPIREVCLTADDQPNENSGRVQAALDKKGCKAQVVFDATEPYIT